MKQEFLVVEWIHLAPRQAQGPMQHETKWLDWLAKLFPVHHSGYLEGTLLRAVQMLIIKQKTASKCLFDFTAWHEGDAGPNFYS